MSKTSKPDEVKFSRVTVSRTDDYSITVTRDSDDMWYLDQGEDENDPRIILPDVTAAIALAAGITKLVTGK